MLRSSPLQFPTLALVASASLLVQTALYERQPAPYLGWLQLGLTAAAALLLAWRGRTLWRLRAVPQGSLALLSAVASPPLWDLATRGLLGVGDPYEVLLAYVLRNLMLVLALRLRTERSLHYAALASFFLTIFSFLWTLSAWTVVLMACYGIIGTWWLMVSYWAPLGGRFADTSTSHVPARPATVVLTLAILGGLAAAPLATSTGMTTALDGFFPSSGGTKFSDSQAHGGVGDGDQMVAAKEEASSFGPIESELFLESQMPSLYDAINEFSEATPDKNKRPRRAIPLAPSQTQTNHQKRGLTQQATREFSTVRQKSRPHTTTADLRSAALLLVSGRTPTHLALDTFDGWDGRSLIASTTHSAPSLKLGPPEATKRRWLSVGEGLPLRIFPARTETQVRIINLNTERVPSPPSTTAVTIDNLHNAGMFRYASDGSLAMDVESIPQMTILRVRSGLRDRSARPEPTVTSPLPSSPRVAKIARDWTEELPSGWRQVEAVVARLRSDYVWDPEAVVPSDAEDAVEHFLTASRRGPDYLFAASAAVLLRSIGYETRVRSGFYASPIRYDRLARVTPVLAEDAHFWVEVRAQDGAAGPDSAACWIAVEPTPGYDLLYAPESLLGWLGRQARELYRGVCAKPLTASTLSIAAALAVAYRIVLIDVAVLGLWRLVAPWGDVRRRARVALRLVEWRAWAHRCRRPKGVPLGRWNALHDNREFISVASWALYGEGAPAPAPLEVMNSVCDRVTRIKFCQTAR